MKKAVCIGINNYQNAPKLMGCINDAQNWAKLLSGQFGFETTLLLDQQATSLAILTQLQQLIMSLDDGDYGVLHYSGHGTYELDSSGDEPDGYDEALFTFDGGLIFDDNFRKLLEGLNPKARLVFIIDSCFSGTVTRVVSERNTLQATPRFIHPADFHPGIQVKSRIFKEVQMPELLLSGCGEAEYAYDIKIGSDFHGAMSFYAIQAIKEALEANPQATFINAFNLLRKHLPSQGLPQTPQLEGNDVIKNSLLFGFGTVEKKFSWAELVDFLRRLFGGS